MNKSICFSDNLATVQTAFRDYMAQYMDDNGVLTGLPYSKNKSFAEKEKDMNALMMNEVKKLSGISFSETPLSLLR